MEKIDEQLIVAILSKDEKTACASITNGANVNQLVCQKRTIETPDGIVTSLCHEKTESVLMIACQMDLNKVVLTLLEHGADVNIVDDGKAFSDYKSRHSAFEMVCSCRRISRHNATVTNENRQKEREA